MIPEFVVPGKAIFSQQRVGEIRSVLRDSGQILVRWPDGTTSIVLEEDFYVVLSNRSDKT